MIVSKAFCFLKFDFPKLLRTPEPSLLKLFVIRTTMRFAIILPLASLIVSINSAGWICLFGEPFPLSSQVLFILVCAQKTPSSFSFCSLITAVYGRKSEADMWWRTCREILWALGFQETHAFLARSDAKMVLLCRSSIFTIIQGHQPDLLTGWRDKLGKHFLLQIILALESDMLFYKCTGEPHNFQKWKRKSDGGCPRRLHRCIWILTWLP